MAMAARMPMIATTIISSMRVKPRWFATVSRFLVHHRIIGFLLTILPYNFALHDRPLFLAMGEVQLRCHRRAWASNAIFYLFRPPNSGEFRNSLTALGGVVTRGVRSGLAPTWGASESSSVLP